MHVTGPDGPALASVGTGHLTPSKGPDRASPLCCAKCSPWSSNCASSSKVGCDAVDDVERGSNDSDWQPVKDAARAMAFTEDRAVFEGYEAVEFHGLRRRTSHPVHALPVETRAYPDAGELRADDPAPGRSRRPVFAAAGATRTPW